MAATSGSSGGGGGGGGGVLLPTWAPTRERVIVLLDLDCFYCQVEQKRLGIGADVPFGVRQWSALIAVNYAARAKGVKSREVDLKDALKLCPQLQFVHTDTINQDGSHNMYLPNQAPPPYDRCKITLQRYREESEKIMQVLRQFSDKVVVEKASIDEAFIDVSDLVQERMDSCVVPCNFQGVVEGYDDNPPARPLSLDQTRILYGSHIASDLRNLVYEKLGYTSSAGISDNKMVSKMASSRNKPDQQTVVLSDQVVPLMKRIRMKDVRFLGGKFGQKLLELGAKAPYDVVELLPQHLLVDTFDRKTAEWVYNLCQGIDHSPVVPKMLSRQLESAKRFREPLTNMDAVFAKIKLLTTEIVHRLEIEKEHNHRVPTSLTVLCSMGSRQRGIPVVEPDRVLNLEWLVPQAMALFRKFGSSALPCHRLSIRVSCFTEWKRSCSSSSIHRYLLCGSNVRTPPSEAASTIVAPSPDPTICHNADNPREENREQDSSSAGTTTTAMVDIRPDPNDSSEYRCGLCGKMVAVKLHREHSDFHVALDLQSYEQKRSRPGQKHTPKRSRDQPSIHAFFKKSRA